jgi:hypothetical protein
MKRALVLSVLVALLGSAVAWAGPTIGFSSLNGDFIPFALGVQYDGQYGFGVGVEVFDSDLFDGDWYDTYGGEAFLTFDLSDNAYLSAGFLTLVEVADLSPGTSVTPTYYGTFGGGFGQYGSSVYIKAIYDFTGSDALVFQLGVRIDVFGIYHMAKAKLDALNTPEQ